jgi:hypothetical protein
MAGSVWAAGRHTCHVDERASASDRLRKKLHCTMRTRWPLGRGMAKQTHVVQQYKAGNWLMRDNSINTSKSESMLWCTMLCTRVQWADEENASLGWCQQSVSQSKQWTAWYHQRHQFAVRKSNHWLCRGTRITCIARSWCWQGVLSWEFQQPSVGRYLGDTGWPDRENYLQVALYVA